ncbi:hypothetical protein [Treponema sp.]|uniref:hypothetical protein n=1 Tax=Treponema sp. TaxID=166 RepID=UPI0025E07707|nr:hypothetical protein [Treponema sp.]MCR5218146.1 hypothetical protein [Treponema sp.]
MSYKYGEEVLYKIRLLKFSDKKNIQDFSCGNECIDNYVKNEIFSDSELNTEDGLHFIVYIKKTKKIIGFFSLAASGIIHKVDNYVKILPAIKIDIFAIDVNFQKMHFDKDSKAESNPDNHFYFSDKIMGEVIKRCQSISEKHLKARFIVLYADKKALRFYKRNKFANLEKFMEPEKNQEVKNLTPMYMEL